MNARSWSALKMTPAVSFFAGLAILLLLVAANHWVFATYFSTSYLQWYLGNAAAIGIGSAFVSTVWGALDRHPGLISAHPFTYAGTYFQLVGVSVFALGTNVKGKIASTGRASPFDQIAGGILALLLGLVFALGILVVAPLQYFMFLVFGAPGRLVLASDRRAIAFVGETRWNVDEIEKGKEIPPGWQDVSFSAKPFALTNLLVGLAGSILKLAGFDRLF